MSHHHHHHFKIHEQHHKKRDRKHDKAALDTFIVKLTAVAATKYDEAVENPKTADEAWARLKEGNQRFVKGDLTEYVLHLAHEVNPARRQQLGLGQHPFAVILTCSDSRVSPELIFDQGLGDLFVVRTAGNVPDKVALGSIEYGLLHLKSPLLVILGHTKCGAVTATVDVLTAKSKGEVGHGEDNTHIGSIVQEISAPAEVSFKKYQGTQHDVVFSAVKRNVRNVGKQLPALSPPVQQLIQSGSVKVVLAVYNVDNGEVTVTGMNADNTVKTK